MDAFDERVEQRYSSMFAEYSDLDEMTVDMLRTYCVTCVQIDDLNEIILREGYLIEDAKGKLIEHPAVNTMHKLNADKARYFAPLKRHLSKQVEDGIDDDFDNFLAG